jgi:hypothetical protein
MTERERRVLNTVGVLKSWDGADVETQKLLKFLCDLGYLYRVARKPRTSGIPERAPFYRLTPRGQVVVSRRTSTKQEEAQTKLSPGR